MEHAFNRRSGILAALLVTAAAGVAWAQGGFEESMIEGGSPHPVPLNLAITLSDGQIIQVNATSVEITFAKHGGGVLRVTESGALPVVSSQKLDLPMPGLAGLDPEATLDRAERDRAELDRVERVRRKDAEWRERFEAAVDREGERESLINAIEQ